MIVGVGSKNPAKVKAVTKVFRKSFPKARVISISVPSGVSRMPLTAHETMKGAELRANYLLKHYPKIDIAVGVEGGIERTHRGAMLCSYTCIMDREGTVGIGGGTATVIPERIAKAVFSGDELGDIMDRIVGRRRTQDREGAIGILTNGLVNRESLFRFTTSCALAPFLKKELYS